MIKSRKLMSILLVVAMLFTLAAPAMAEGETTEKVAITVSDDRTYEVYQIFTGDLHGGKLSNVVWGKNGTGTEGQAVPQETLNELAAKKDSTNDIEKLAVIKNYVQLENPIGTVNKNKTLEVASGYYLLKDVTTGVTGGQELSTFVVEIVGDVTITPKVGEVTSQKKVKDTNDSVANSTTDTDWQDSADHDITDEVQFQLTGTVTAKYDHYDKYYYAFHDKQSDGLTFKPETVKVYVVNGETRTEVAKTYYNVVTPGADAKCKFDERCTFEVVFADLKEIEVNDTAIVNKDSKIVVEYTSTLNDNAVIGAAGNPNEMYLEYSNNPNWDGEGKGPTSETPEDKVIVFTYQTVINKVDEKDEALAGAEFTLEKKQADGEWEAINVVETKPDTTFTFKGLDDGFYRLKETVTPAGYNTIDDIYFEITAAHDTESQDPKLTRLTAIQKTEENGNLEEGKVTFKPTYTLADGKIATKVVNNSGATLPETGGIGTTIFYVVGGALVLGAAVLLVTRRRMAE